MSGKYIYVVVEGCGYDGSHMLGVYSSLSRAREVAEREAPKSVRSQNSIEIHKVPLDSVAIPPREDLYALEYLVEYYDS